MYSFTDDYLFSMLIKKKNHQASLVAQTIKRLSAMQETWVQSLGQEDPVEGVYILMGEIPKYKQQENTWQ